MRVSLGLGPDMAPKQKKEEAADGASPMPPKKHRRVGKAPEPDAVRDMPQLSTGVNGAIYELIQKSWATISAHPDFADIVQEEPLEVCK